MDRFSGLLGVLVILAIAYGLSENRRAVKPRIVIGGIGLQLMLAVLLLWTPLVADGFEHLARGFTRLLGFSQEGAAFVFQGMASPDGPVGWVFAFQVLTVIIFFASLMSVLYHLGIMQRLIAGVGWVLCRTLGVSGAEGFCAAANIFVGQTEAPLCIKPFIHTMTRSQLMIVMTTGFATIAGGVLLAYVGMLGGTDEAAQTLFAKHLLTASLMSAPGAFVIAKLMIPETETVDDAVVSALAIKTDTVNVIDAAAAGATDGLKLALNVGAMLIAFVALIAMLNYPLQAWVSPWFMSTGMGRSLTQVTGVQEVSIQSLLGLCFCPIAWLMGIAWNDAINVGSLLGIQVIATEFLAYDRLGDLMRDGTISPRSAAIATYALCGFANLPSIAIQIGGLSAIAPERRQDFARLGLRAMVAGAMACWMNAAIASVFLA